LQIHFVKHQNHLVMTKILPLFMILTLAIWYPVNAQQTGFAKVFYDLYGSVSVYAATPTPDHHILMVGERDGFQMVMKISHDGDTIWHKKFLVAPLSSFSSVCSTYDSGFLISGDFFGEQGYDMFCMRLNAVGDTIWSKRVLMGGTEKSYAVKETTDHGVILAGYSYPNVGDTCRISVVRLDSMGQLVWGRNFYGLPGIHFVTGLDQTADGGFIITGTIESSWWEDGVFFLMKLSPDGTLCWMKKKQPSTPGSSIGLDVKTMADGYLCLLATNDEGLVLMKSDTAGNVIWSKGYNMYGYPYLCKSYSKISSTSDGGYLILLDLCDGFPGSVSKINGNGDVVWQSDFFLEPIDVRETSDGGFLVMGNGPLIGVIMSPTNNPQIGIIKTDAMGNSLACITPIVSQTVLYEISLVPVNVISQNGGNILPVYPEISRPPLSMTYGCVAIIGNIQEENTGRLVLKVSPNPAREMATIHFSDFLEKLTNGQKNEQTGGFWVPATAVNFQSKETRIEVSDVFGRLIFSQVVSQQDHNIELNVSAWPQGIYFARLIFMSEVAAMTKFVVGNCYPRSILY